MSHILRLIGTSVVRYRTWYVPSGLHRHLLPPGRRWPKADEVSGTPKFTAWMRLPAFLKTVTLPAGHEAQMGDWEPAPEPYRSTGWPVWRLPEAGSHCRAHCRRSINTIRLRFGSSGTCDRPLE